MACKARQPYLSEDHIRVALSLDRQRLQIVQNNQHAFQGGFDGIDPAFLSMNQKETFKALFDSVFTALDLRELSNNESTDS